MRGSNDLKLIMLVAPLILRAGRSANSRRDCELLSHSPSYVADTTPWRWILSCEIRPFYARNSSHTCTAAGLLLRPSFQYFQLRVQGTPLLQNWLWLLHLLPTYSLSGSRDSSVGIATGYRLDGRGVAVRVPVGAKFVSSSRRPDWFWRPLSLLSNRYWGCFRGGKAAGAWSRPFTSN
jgi:hypothetical protein